MPYGITLKSCNATAGEILRLWEEASIFEPIGSMQELGYPPHITLAVFAQRPLEVSSIMRAVFRLRQASRLPLMQWNISIMTLWSCGRNPAPIKTFHIYTIGCTASSTHLIVTSIIVSVVGLLTAPLRQECRSLPDRKLSLGQTAGNLHLLSSSISQISCSSRRS